MSGNNSGNADGINVEGILKKLEEKLGKLKVHPEGGMLDLGRGGPWGTPPPVALTTAPQPPTERMGLFLFGFLGVFAAQVGGSLVGFLRDACRKGWKGRSGKGGGFSGERNEPIAPYMVAPEKLLHPGQNERKPR